MKHKNIIIRSSGKMEEDIWSGKSLRQALDALVKFAQKMEAESIKEQNEIHNGVDSKSS